MGLPRAFAPIVAVTCVTLGATALAQTFRAHSDLVVLQVSVHDRHAEPVPNLTQDAFQVFEDGVPQHIDFFVSEDQPVAIGLVVDNSGSMEPKRAEVIAGAEAFVRASNPDDALFTVNFNEHVFFGLPEGTAFTSDPDRLHQALLTIGAQGQTAMYDAVAVALEHVGTSPLDRHVLVVLSDGKDNRSRLTFDDVMARALRSNASIYAVGIFDALEGGDRPALEHLADATGGLAFFPGKLAEVRRVLDRICLDVRHRYTIGYTPTNGTAQGGFRTVKVTAVDPKDHQSLSVRARSGYVAQGGDASR